MYLLHCIVLSSENINNTIYFIQILSTFQIKSKLCLFIITGRLLFNTLVTSKLNVHFVAFFMDTAAIMFGVFISIITIVTTTTITVAFIISIIFIVISVVDFIFLFLFYQPHIIFMHCSTCVLCIIARNLENDLKYVWLFTLDFNRWHMMLLACGQFFCSFLIFLMNEMKLHLNHKFFKPIIDLLTEGIKHYHHPFNCSLTHWMILEIHSPLINEWDSIYILKDVN